MVNTVSVKHLHRWRLGELLVAQKLITPEQLEQALSLQREQRQPLGQILIQQGLVTEKRLLLACALQKGVPAWHLQEQAPDPEAVLLVTEEMCRRLRVLPVQAGGGRVTLAMCHPDDVQALDAVQRVTQMRVEPVLCDEGRLLQALDSVWGVSRVSVSGEASLSRLVSEALGEFDVEGRDARTEGSWTEAELRPVVGLVNQILSDAVRAHASDIHIEPRAGRIDIRYRIDGRLHRAHEIPPKLHPALVARLKIMSLLDIVEYRLPQDGRLTVSVDGRPIDLRISVLPNLHGQRVVLRILDRSATVRKLSDLGMSEHNRPLFLDMVHKPYGLVLVTGPTGSGKTTTLYAALQQLKDGGNNIMTCEDPVEYDIDGINQSHVHDKIGLTFAVQLKAILRQDPDVVLVGEIRDRETAETAIRAALTGHLVLSTLHCNNASSAIPRLSDMGIEPFLLSTALIGVTAQRLVRLLCSHCKVQKDATPRERALLAPFTDAEVSTLWHPAGCERCSQTGFAGRAGVHEVMVVAPEMQRAIAAREPMDSLQTLAGQYGYRSMAADACARVLGGQTTLDEVRRLVFFDTLVPGAAASVPEEETPAVGSAPPSGNNPVRRAA